VATGVLDPIVGDPTEIWIAASNLQSIALEVAEVSSRVRSLAAGDWSGAAASSARARSATLPPKLDKASVSYATAGGALVAYARTLAEAQQQSQSAIASANRASDDVAAARAAQAAAAQSDAAAVAAAHALSTPPPPATAPRFEGVIEEAADRLARARALNEQAHELQTVAARTAGSALHQASHEGIHNASWLHHFTSAVGHWAATQWSHALRALSKIATVISALAGIAALALAVAGVLFPPLEAAAAVLESISLASAVVAGMADTVLAATGKSSWNAVGIDALTLAPTGLGKLVTKVAPMLRESRLITPTTVVHASTGEAHYPPRVIGIVRAAARGRGNHGLGSASHVEAEASGRLWVGAQAFSTKKGKILISADRLRQFRAPTLKPSLGIYQANFEAREISCGPWLTNGHLDVSDLP
jgi:hypothetical protein